MGRRLRIVSVSSAGSSGVPLVLDPRLTQAAQEYAESMATLGFFDHTSPDGSSPRTRIEGAGYPGSTWGENIASGYGDAESVMRGWIHSPGHRANLVKPGYTVLGAGFRSPMTAREAGLSSSFRGIASMRMPCGESAFSRAVGLPFYRL